MKELEMAKAKRDAVKAFEDEERKVNLPSLGAAKEAQSNCELNGAPPLLQLKRPQVYSPLITDPGLRAPDPQFLRPPVNREPAPVKLETHLSPTTPEQLFLPVMNEQLEVKFKLPWPPIKANLQNINPFSDYVSPSPLLPLQEYPYTSSSEGALQEIIRLQAKQIELSALIAEQQRISSLPVQEPPVFSGSYFDYPMFVDTIIEGKVAADNERLYFLNKYTSGKANEVIKGFVTLNSKDGYK